MQTLIDLQKKRGELYHSFKKYHLKISNFFPLITCFNSLLLLLLLKLGALLQNGYVASILFCKAKVQPCQT